jgi:DNA invertase Pin-like site-specific DNA recombinase
MISARTKAGLLAAKNRGVALGTSMDAEKSSKGRTTQSEVADRNAARVKVTIASLRAVGATLQATADELNNMSVPTPRGKQWTPTAVKNAQARA